MVVEHDEHEGFDVDGNLVRQSRRLAAAYDITPDWGALDDVADPTAMDAATAGLLEAETFTTEQSFDAMGRPVTQTTPDASVLHLGYGDAGHLETVAANVRGDVAQTSFVTDLRYNARGQRTLVAYGNGTQTTYAYDPLTFRLTQLQTERIVDGHLHQDLRYSFDPVGNITEIRDLAQPIVFTSNAAISADQRFEYDALYRLVHAEGREHGTQGQPVADDFIPRAAPEDPTGLRAYVEQYLYDAVGNILQMQHVAVGGSWTRHYRWIGPPSLAAVVGSISRLPIPWWLCSVLEWSTDCATMRRRCCSPSGITRSRHSRRMEPMKRSAYAFRLGLRARRPDQLRHGSPLQRPRPANAGGLPPQVLS